MFVHWVVVSSFWCGLTAFGAASARATSFLARLLSALMLNLYFLFDVGGSSGVGSAGDQLLLGLRRCCGVSGSGDVGDRLAFAPIVGAALHASMMSLPASIFPLAVSEVSMSLSVSSMSPGNVSGEVVLCTLPAEFASMSSLSVSSMSSVSGDVSGELRFALCIVQGELA